MSMRFRRLAWRARMRACADRPNLERRTVVAFLIGAVSGAALTYGLEPGAGRRRRAGGRILGLSRRGTRRLARTARVTTRQTTGRAKGLVHGLRPTPVRELDDVELAHKVESIVYRDSSIPKGQISVNAEGGRVFLRGQVDAPDLVERLEKAVREVAGVQDVENLLHLPGAPAPHARGGALLRDASRAQVDR